MKKKIIEVTAMAVVVGWNYNQSKNNKCFMIKKKYLILFMLFSFFIISCNDQKKGYTDSLSCQSEHLYAKILNDTFMLASPKGLFLWDSLLVVIDARCGNNLFYMFSSSDGAFLKSGGKKGEGPGEVANPSNAYLNSEGILSYWDLNKSRIVRYSINGLLSGSESYYSEFHFGGELMLTSFLDIIALKNGYLYNGNTDRHIGIYGMDSSLDSPVLPDVPSREIDRAIMNKCHWAIAPDEKRMVRATSIGGIVQSYTVESDRVEECWSKLFFPPVYKLVEGVKPAWISWCEDSQMGFDNLYVTDQHIYLLLNGKFAKNKPFANEVLVMDWNGNIEKKFIFDKTVKTIAVDEDKRVIYATTCGFDVEATIVIFPF